MSRFDERVETVLQQWEEHIEQLFLPSQAPDLSPILGVLIDQISPLLQEVKREVAQIENEVHKISGNTDPKKTSNEPVNDPSAPLDPMLDPDGTPWWDKLPDWLRRSKPEGVDVTDYLKPAYWFFRLFTMLDKWWKDGVEGAIDRALWRTDIVPNEAMLADVRNRVIALSDHFDQCCLGMREAIDEFADETQKGFYALHESLESVDRDVESKLDELLSQFVINIPLWEDTFDKVQRIEENCGKIQPERDTAVTGQILTDLSGIKGSIDDLRRLLRTALGSLED